MIEHKDGSIELMNLTEEQVEEKKKDPDIKSVRVMRIGDDAVINGTQYVVSESGNLVRKNPKDSKRAKIRRGERKRRYDS